MENLPVLHVVVVGFHHKKGCQVEYSVPPLIPGGDSESAELPSQWKHLPSLALPDGSHNFEQDTVYFHLQALDDPRKTVFGISCYRQIDAEALINKTDDITRGTVQKSVCVLSRLPLYGHIQVKMSLITEAYFREGDFTRLDLIHETYENLNACLTNDMLRSQQLYVGLSARNFVSRFKQKSLILFKLLLLERKVLFFQSPVNELCSIFLTLLSLHPGMLEDGLDEAACTVPVDTPPCTSPVQKDDVDALDETDRDPVTGRVKGRLSGALGYIGVRPPSSESNLADKVAEEGESQQQQQQQQRQQQKQQQQQQLPDFSSLTSVSSNELGLPMKIFTGGNLCHPYLSLSYLDVLTQPSIHGYIIGATNILFKQKKGLAEVIIDIEKDRFGISDPELKRALTLTTEDLRFTENLIKHVSEECSDVFLDGVGWEGGDEWIRAQFRFYLICLLRSSVEDKADQFNPAFINLWKKTKNYGLWASESHDVLVNLLPVGHPFAGGHLSVTDVKLHLSNTITNTESGKRVTAAVANTGKAVAGGLSSAKGALSSWMSSFKQDPPPPEQAEEASS